MADPFLGEISMVGFNYAPRGWATCDGQILPINQNQSLYSLLGTTYGGDGRTSFALPDLRGRAPIHPGNGHTQGQRSGSETVTLTTGQIASHDHTLSAYSEDADESEPEDLRLAKAEGNTYVNSGTAVAMGSGAVTNAGGGQGHDNMQPYLALNFCIALSGLFPSRN